LAPLVRAPEARADAAASTASRPAFRDDREPPLRGDETVRGYVSDLGQRKTEIFFAKDLDRANQLERKAKIAIFAQLLFRK
jgi:hypothetical protein